MNPLENQIITQLAKKITDVERGFEELGKKVVQLAQLNKLLATGLNEANERIARLEQALSPTVSG
jgi:phage shock protein A